MRANRHAGRTWLSWGCLPGWLLLGCATLVAEVPTESSPVRVAVPPFEKFFRVAPRVYSGSQPEGDAAFVELARMGIKTVVSVDGARPDLDSARRHGLRYVHLPIGYDGIPAGRAVELARVVREMAGPIFVHCHHGRHRGPAAAAIICMTGEGWNPTQAEAWLRQAGTAPEYAGLYRSVREFRGALVEATDNPLPPLPESTPTSTLVEAMVAIDESFDTLKAAQKSGWKVPTEGDRGTQGTKQGLAETAVLLWERLRELGRDEDTLRRPAEYRRDLGDAEEATAALRKALAGDLPHVAAAGAAMERLGNACSRCHREYRN